MLTVAAPIVAVVVSPERSEQRLTAWKGWLLGNSRTVGLVVLMIVAVALIVRGASDLIRLGARRGEVGAAAATPGRGRDGPEHERRDDRQKR